MSGPTQKIVDFAVATKYQDLSKETVDKLKEILLDSIGCALGSYVVDRARLVCAMAEDCGGYPQATIIGGRRTSTDLAAFVNGDMICALDFECVGPLTGHVTPYVLPACLATAERVHASGKELLTALALAHEIGGRATSSMAQIKILKKEPPYYEESPRFTYASTIFGGAAGAGKLLGLDATQMANALGIAGASCPVPGGVAFQYTAKPANMTKFNAWSGWVARLGTVAAIMAEKGFTANTEIFDGEQGFWKIAGSPYFKEENLVGKLGELWHINLMECKQYPCCRLNHASIDGIVSLMRKNKIQPEDIEQITVKGDPLLQVPLRTHATVENFADCQFTNTYLCAVAAYFGQHPSPAWQMPGTFNRPEIKALMKKVKVQAHPRSSEFITNNIKNGLLPTFSATIVEIKANGKKFTEDVPAPRGCRENPLTQKEIVAKFKNNASFSQLPSIRCDDIVQMISKLEKLDDINDLTDLLAIP